VREDFEGHDPVVGMFPAAYGRLETPNAAFVGRKEG
jgi:hypothetical protein